VKRIQENEGAPPSCANIASGNEPPGFWNAAVSCGFNIPHNAAGSPVREVEPPPEMSRRGLADEDAAMRMGNRHYQGPDKTASQQPELTAFEKIKMQQMAEDNPEPMSRRERVSEDEYLSKPVKKEENEEEGKLFTYPDWQELEMFDSDDLVSDLAMVLLPNKKPVKAVHVWCGAEFLEDTEDEAAEIAGEFLALKGLPSTTEIKVEVEGDESDTFWDYFVNG